MVDNQEENALRKKAIFDSMGKRGQERILRIGYENWDPFQEPKDPRERMYSSSSMKSYELIKEFYEIRNLHEESVSLNKELFEICRGLLQGERRSQVMVEFCNWLKERLG